MTADEAARALDDLAWEEQVDFEAGERGVRGAVEPSAPAGLRALAVRLDPALLDALEGMGYEEWVLRLAPHVPGDDPAARARRWMHSDDAHVRYWAGVILKDVPPAATE